MKTHNLKILRDFADAVYRGDKTFEVRKNDRGYQKGDIVVFKAMEDTTLTMPNHPINKTKYMITYVLNGWGIKEDYVVFGIKEVKEALDEDNN